MTMLFAHKATSRHSSAAVTTMLGQHAFRWFAPLPLLIFSVLSACGGSGGAGGAGTAGAGAGTAGAGAGAGGGTGGTGATGASAGAGGGTGGDCPAEAICDGQCVTLSTDASNCGSCGRVCQDCVSGNCNPQKLADADTSPGVQTCLVHQGKFYWADPLHGVRSVSVGKFGASLIADTQATGMAADSASSSIYWIDQNGIRKYTTAGPGQGSIITLTPKTAYTVSIGFALSHVYWSGVNPIMGPGTDLWRVGINGDPAESLIPISDSFTGFCAVWADENNIYAQDGSLLFKIPHGTQDMTLLDDSPPECFNGGQPPSSASIAMDETTFYIPKGSPSHYIAAVPLDGGPSDTIATLPSSVAPIDIAVDPWHVYWSSTDGNISRATKSDWTSELFIDGQEDMLCLAVDGEQDGFVYWVTTNAVFAIEKHTTPLGDSAP